MKVAMIHSHRSKSTGEGFSSVEIEQYAIKKEDEIISATNLLERK